MAPKISCALVDMLNGQVIVHYEIRNVGSEAIFLIDSKRLPYQLVDGAMITILHGVNAPKPDRLYNGIEIPPSLPLPPGTALTGHQLLPVKVLHDHYEEYTTALHGKFQVQCAVGWGTSPLHNKMSIDTLLTWQHITNSEPVDIMLP